MRGEWVPEGTLPTVVELAADLDWWFAPRLAEPPRVREQLSGLCARNIPSRSDGQSKRRSLSCPWT